MSACVSSDRLGRVGCGATFGGEMQHSVAKVPWSEHPDGMAHITARLSVIDKCWAKGTNGIMANPADLGFAQDERGTWRQPMSDADRERLSAVRSESSISAVRGPQNSHAETE